MDSLENKIYKAPSELKNFWMTDQQSMARFSSWCYDVEEGDVKSEMARIKEKINAGK